MLKKFLSVALSCGMVLSLMPTCAFASGVTGETAKIKYSSEAKTFSFWGDSDGLVEGETEYGDAEYGASIVAKGFVSIGDGVYGKPLSEADKEQYRESLEKSSITLNFDKDIIRIEEGETGRSRLDGKYPPIAYTIVVPEGTTITMSESSGELWPNIQKRTWTVKDANAIIGEESHIDAQFPDMATLNTTMQELAYEFSFCSGPAIFVEAGIKVRVDNENMPDRIYADERKPDTKKPNTRNDAIVLKIDSMDAHVFGEKVTKDAAPVIRNGRTMLPIRFVVEALGGTVGWDETQQEVAIKLNTAEIGVGIGSKTAQVGDKEVNLDSPAYVENGRTYLPLRFVAENLGAEVLWDNETREVIIIPDK